MVANFVECYAFEGSHYFATQKNSTFVFTMGIAAA